MSVCRDFLQFSAVNRMREVPECVRLLVEAGSRAPSADNMQPWSFRWGGETLRLGYDTKRAAGVTFPASHPATRIALGAAAQNMLLVAERLDLELEWAEAGAEDIIRFRCNPGTRVPAEVWRHPLFERHTNRMPYKMDAIPAGVLASVNEEREGNLGIKILAGGPEIREMGRLVRLASELRFQTREVHEWLARSLRFSQKEVSRGNGLDVATLSLPPGGRLLLKWISEWRRMALLNRIGGYRMLARIEAQAVSKAPALLAITGPAGENAAFEAGRLLERVWIALNRQGVAVHPYYVIPDQLQRFAAGVVPSIENAQVLKQGVERALDGMPLHMLLRVGWPKRRPIRSCRLPIEAVLAPASEPAR